MKKVWIAIGIIGLAGIIYAGRSVLLSANHEYYIKQMHKEAQPKMRKLIKKAVADGYDVIITSGYRSWAKQNELYQAGLTPTRAGNSLHNYGFAIDLNLRKGTEWYRKSDSVEKWNSTGIPQFAKSIGLEWGGDYSGYHDPVHFEYEKYSTAILKQLAVNQFGSNPNEIEGNQVNIV